MDISETMLNLAKERPELMEDHEEKYFSKNGISFVGRKKKKVMLDEIKAHTKKIREAFESGEWDG